MALPEPLPALRERLVEAGFAMVDEHSSHAFGSGVQRLRREGVDVLLVSDRGIPYVELTGPEMGDDSFDGDIWRACIENEDAPTEPRPLDEQVAYLMEHLDAITHAALQDPATTLRCLRTTRRARAEALMGVDLDEGT